MFGPPGAGKGTQASAMVERYNLHHISTGALLRKEIAAETELGKQARELIDKGSLVPDEVVEAMIVSEFDKMQDAVDGFLLDGYPRTLDQARSLDSLLAKKGEKLTSVVSIMIPDEMIFDRIRHRAKIEGREDDASDDIIANRISTYHQKTEPLVNFYKRAGKYAEIDGNGTIEEVREKVFNLLDKA